MIPASQPVSTVDSPQVRIALKFCRRLVLRRHERELFRTLRRRSSRADGRRVRGNRTAWEAAAVTPDEPVSGPATESGRPGNDCEWFERTVVELLPALFGTALRLSRNRADAEDLVADTVA